MTGVVSHWDILAHPVATIRSFGWRVFFTALSPGRNATLLSLLRDSGFFAAGGSKIPTILARCAGLELRAKRIYKALASAWSHHEAVEAFFTGLAAHEQYHADLLELCRAASIRGQWKANLFNPWQDYLPLLEQQMDAIEAALPGIDSVDAALAVVVEIESSEINRVFYAALAATDAVFVERLRPFRNAMEAHLSYLIERLPELSPRMTLVARDLRARFP